MEQRLENSTLVALRELRSYEKERQLAERLKQEEDARRARERRDRECQAEEAARVSALENQLRTDLHSAEEEIRQLREEAALRMREATQALRALASLAKAPSSPAPVSSARRGTWLAASGYAALLASALVLVTGLRRDSWMHSEDSRRSSSCIESVVAPAASPPVLQGSTAAAPATETDPVQSTVSGPSESGRLHPPATHARGPGIPHTTRKPNPPKPICDGTDPLCGLNINSLAPR